MRKRVIAKNTQFSEEIRLTRAEKYMLPKSQILGKVRGAYVNCSGHKKKGKKRTTTRRKWQKKSVRSL